MKIKKIAMYLLRKLKDPVFLVCVLISSLLWLITKLNAVYTETVTVPVVITGALQGVEEKRIANDDKVYDIDCRFSAKGFVLLALHFGKRVAVSPEEVTIRQVPGTEQFEVDPVSMKDALNKRFPNADLLAVLNRRIFLQTTSFLQKKVPLVSDISVALKGEYMQIGSVILDPDSVSVYGNKSVVEKISRVVTEKIALTNPSELITGYVNLRVDEDVEITPTVALYTVVMERYTERKYVAEISLEGSYADSSYVFYPDKTEVVFNVAQNIYAEFDPAKVLFFVSPGNDSTASDPGKNKFLIRHTPLPVGVELRSLYPVAVTVLKNKR